MTSDMQLNAEPATANLFADRLRRGALVFLRYALVVMLVLGGTAKWTAPEAQAIQPWMSHSPFLGFLYHLFSIQGASIAIGVIELTVAVLIATRHWLPRVSAVGSVLGVVTFLITLSLLVTTPHLDASDQGFIMKDAFLLGISVWSAGEAWLAASVRRAPSLSPGGGRTEYA